MTSPEQGPVLVAGASGFVGRRLVPDLVAAGHDVRAMTRSPECVRRGRRARCTATCTTAGSLPAALEGCRAAYYLVHSLDSKDFERLDAEAARAFGEAAADAGVEQIIYLGGLGSDGDELVRAPAQPPRGGGAARRRGGAGDGAAGRHHRRARRHLVGDDPPARRPPAGDGHPALGADQDPADRRERRGPLPRRGARRPEALGKVFEIGGPEVLQYVTCCAGWPRSRAGRWSSSRCRCSPGALVALAVPGHRRGPAGGPRRWSTRWPTRSWCRMTASAPSCRSSRWATTTRCDRPG